MSRVLSTYRAGRLGCGIWLSAPVQSKPNLQTQDARAGRALSSYEELATQCEGSASFSLKGLGHSQRQNSPAIRVL